MSYQSSTNVHSSHSVQITGVERETPYNRVNLETKASIALLVSLATIYSYGRLSLNLALSLR